jgi:tetratricopeptide (TPR) repeat protein
MDKQELIEKYLRGELTLEEEKTLQNLAILDPEFKKELDFEFALKQAMILEKEENLKRQLQALEHEFSTERSILPNIIRWMAAAMLIMGLMFTIFLIGRPKLTSDELFIAYFVPAENIHYPITRGSNDTLMIQAFTVYEKGQFDQALIFFQTLEKTGNYNDLKLYIGSAHLGLGQLTEAIDVLDPSPYENTPLEFRFKWYQSLALIKSGNIEEAQALLVQIVENNGYQSENARSLLKKLPK